MERVESTAETVVVYGTLIPVRESRLSFQRVGKVQEIRNVAGDRVATGDVIALLDQGELDKQRQQLLSSLEQAQQRLRSANRETAPPIQQEIGQLEGQLRGVEAELKQRMIVAPFAGLVSEIGIRQGEIAAPSLPVVVIVADEPPQLAADLVEAMALRVLSQETIWAGLGNRAVELTVKTSSEIRGPTPARRVVFSIKAELPSDSWSYGDVVELRFRETVDTSGCWLPLRAIQKGTGERWYVFAVVPTDDSTGTDSFTAKRRPVDIRLLQNNRAFVESSLTTGEFVIADGTHRIVVGQHVIPVTTAGQSMGADQQGAAN